MDLTLVACEIARAEFERVAGRSSNRVRAVFLPQGHHNDPVAGRSAIQRAIDDADRDDSAAILLGYALCNTMLPGIAARTKPLVVARAHDCITWLLGSRERYGREFSEHPGTYWYSAGWLAAANPDGSAGQSASANGLGISGTYAELVERYGQDNARYLWDVSNAWIGRYDRGMYIRMEGAEHDRHRPKVIAICERNGWSFGECDGDMGLLQRWVDGPWSADEFLIVSPAERIVPTWDSRILTSVPIEQDDDHGCPDRAQDSA